MAVQIDNGRAVASRLQFLDDRISFADVEVKRNVRWSKLMTEVAEEKGAKALQWEEERQRLEREREEVLGSLRVEQR